MRARFAATAVSLFGVGLVAVQVLRWPRSALEAVFTTLPFVLIALALVYVGVWLLRTDDHRSHAHLVLAWTLGGGASFGAVALLVVIGTVAPERLFGAPAVVLDTVSAGALAGALVGLYDAQSRNRYEALQVERDHVERFAHKAASLNRYGKALNQSTSIHEVSALCIEVLELLIGSQNAAVVVVDDESTTVVDATMGTDGRAWIAPIATMVAQEPSMETVRCPTDLSCTLPSELGVDELVAVPIAVDTVGTVVLMSLTGSEVTYSDEDLDLLESLSAHVGTALPDVDTSELDVWPR